MKLNQNLIPEPVMPLEAALELWHLFAQYEAENPEFVILVPPVGIIDLMPDSYPMHGKQ